MLSWEGLGFLNKAGSAGSECGCVGDRKERACYKKQKELGHPQGARNLSQAKLPGLQQAEFFRAWENSARTASFSGCSPIEGTTTCGSCASAGMWTVPDRVLHC